MSAVKGGGSGTIVANYSSPTKGHNYTLFVQSKDSIAKKLPSFDAKKDLGSKESLRSP